MPSDFRARALVRGDLKVPTLRQGVMAAGQVFEKREPLTADGNSRLIRAPSNPSSVIGISLTPAVGLIEGASISILDLGDGKLWAWDTNRFARDGAGTLVTPQLSDVWDLAGLVFAGGNWVLDSGASNKIAQVLAFAGAVVTFRFLEGVANTLPSTIDVTEVSVGGTTISSPTTGAVLVEGGLFGQIDQRGTVSSSPIAGPNTAVYNATLMTIGAAALALSSPTFEPAAGDHTVHTIHFVSNGTAHVVTPSSQYKIAGGATTITMTAVAGEKKIMSCSWNGTRWDCVVSDTVPAN